MDKKLITIIALVAVIAIAGCITGKKDPSKVTEGYPGVIITDFSPTLSSIRAGSPIELLVSAKNMGYFDAKDVNVKIFNCGPSSTGKSDAQPSKPYACNQNISATGFILKKPDREVGIEGEVKEADIMLKTNPASYPAGRTPQTFTARVTYDYKTTGKSDVAFTTFANWKEKGGAVVTGPLNSESTPAPVTLFLNAPTDPIIIDDSSNQQQFTVGLTLKNTGQGFVQDKAMREIRLCFDPKFVEPVPDNPDAVPALQTFSDFGKGIGTDNDGVLDCLVIDTAKDNPKGENLKLIGQTNQYKNVDARFRNKADVIQIQDIATFTSEISYTYSYDSSTTVVISKV